MRAVQRGGALVSWVVEGGGDSDELYSSDGCRSLVGMAVGEVVGCGSAVHRGGTPRRRRPRAAGGWGWWWEEEDDDMSSHDWLENSN